MLSSILGENDDGLASFSFSCPAFMQVHSLFSPWSHTPSKRNLYSVFSMTWCPIGGVGTDCFSWCVFTGGRAGGTAWSVEEMSKDKSVAFQNKLAFQSRTGSSVCLWKRRWKKRGRSWHLRRLALSSAFCTLPHNTVSLQLLYGGINEEEELVI